MARMDLTAVGAVVISALAAVGCSDPPEPPARGGLKVNFQHTGAVGEACITGSSQSTFGVGDPPPDSEGMTIGGPFISGTNETEIGCSISKSGRFRTSFSAPNVTFDLRGTVGGPVSVSAFAPSASVNVVGDGCVATPYEYYAGETYMHFECPYAKSPSYPGTACVLSGAVVVLLCPEG